MELNITVFIQGFNFFIAYLMIRRMVLERAVIMIRQLRVHQAALEQAVKDRKILVMQKEHERTVSWEAIQQELMTLHPAQSERVIVFSSFSSSFSGQTPAVTSDAVETAVKEMTAVLSTLGGRVL